MTPKEVWISLGSVGGIKSWDLQVKDDTVIAACFASQVLYRNELDDFKKNTIEKTVRSGDMTACCIDDHNRYLTIEQIFYIERIVSILKSVPTYEFRVCWGYPETCKLAYIFEFLDSSGNHCDWTKYAFNLPK